MVEVLADPAGDNAEVDHSSDPLTSKDHDTDMAIDGGTTGCPSTEEDTGTYPADVDLDRPQHRDCG